ncbi:hypothetical protein ACFQGT_16160 [Natrialbaceae archaeon GCM10025810]|uniref:DUF7344 domain-containing protein n=1 Tax=Halovalidus salilacus TaxID=3075124 RepID=UPI0036230498
MVERLRLERATTPEFLDTLFVLLADSRRRSILQVLVERGRPATVHRLAAELAALEYDVPVADVQSDQQHELFLELAHVHLPLLDDTGMLAWDRETERVALTPLLDQLSVTVPDLRGLFAAAVPGWSEPR